MAVPDFVKVQLDLLQVPVSGCVPMAGNLCSRPSFCHFSTPVVPNHSFEDHKSSPIIQQALPPKFKSFNILRLKVEILF